MESERKRDVMRCLTQGYRVVGRKTHLDAAQVQTRVRQPRTERRKTEHAVIQYHPRFEGLHRESGIPSCSESGLTSHRRSQSHFSYQLTYMYLRYLMWNFSGRYNDRQGHGSPQNGQFLTGVPPLDRLLVGTSAKIPPSLPSGPLLVL